MPTRISTGTSVQTTSISELCVVLDGTGLAGSHDTGPSPTAAARSTKIEMTVMIGMHDHVVHPCGILAVAANTASASRSRPATGMPMPSVGFIGT